MSSRVRPENWRPADGIVLEPVVDRAVRSTSNAIVIAGPGAGKTELLAQRACFLLQTGICPLPKRILALSFKRDAAGTLRPGWPSGAPDHARRFDSLTFESFGKTLLDRFGRALPTSLRPEQHYEITFKIKEREASKLIRSLPDSATTLTTAEIESRRADRVLPESLHGQVDSANRSAQLDFRAVSLRSLAIPAPSSKAHPTQLPDDRPPCRVDSSFEPHGFEGDFVVAIPSCSLTNSRTRQGSSMISSELRFSVHRRC